MKIIHSIILIMTTVFSMTTVFADYKVYVQNKLGTDRNLTEFYGNLQTLAGINLINGNALTAPLLPNKSKLIASGQTSEQLILIDRSVSVKYLCASGGTDCWPQDYHGLGIPGFTLYCDNLGNYTINTADKILGNGVHAKTYSTTNLRFILNPDFTLTYRVIRKSEDGFTSKDEGNISIQIARSRCGWAT